MTYEMSLIIITLIRTLGQFMLGPFIKDVINFLRFLTPSPFAITFTILHISLSPLIDGSFMNGPYRKKGEQKNIIYSSVYTKTQQFIRYFLVTVVGGIAQDFIKRSQYCRKCYAKQRGGLSTILFYVWKKRFCVYQGQNSTIS